MLLQTDPFFTNVLGRLATAPVAAHPAGQHEQFVAPMDAYRRDADVWVHIDLPGIAADSIDISVERSVLTVTGERWSNRHDGDHAYVSDRRHGQFRRQVNLGEGLDADNIEADYHDGVLTLRIPVAEKAKPRKIEVKATPAATETTGELTDVDPAPAAG